MPMVLSSAGGLYAISKSAFGVLVAFLDENGNPVTPSSVTWTLTDATGALINGRLNQIVPAAQAVTIGLSGEDIDYATTMSKRRVLTVTALYNSTTFGPNTPDVD